MSHDLLYTRFDYSSTEWAFFSNNREPQLVKKNQAVLTDALDRKVLSMYALGMSYQDIAAHISEMYDLDISHATISAVADQLIPELKA